MRRHLLLLAWLLVAPGVAAAAPATPDAWATALKARYPYARSAKTSTSTKPVHLGLCGGKVIAPRPGSARLELDFHDENLFQDARIDIGHVAPGVDVIAEVKRAGARCHANKRYQVVIQAGDTVFRYDARCSQMRTPWYYDVADLVAAIAAEGGAVEAEVIANMCGAFDHAFVTRAELERRAKQPRKLYRHRFPASREAFKRRKAP